MASTALISARSKCGTPVTEPSGRRSTRSTGVLQRTSPPAAVIASAIAGPIARMPPSGNQTPSIESM